MSFLHATPLALVIERDGFRMVPTRDLDGDIDDLVDTETDADAPSPAPVLERPTCTAELLTLWHARLDGLAPELLFGDLIHLLRQVSDIELLNGLLACDVGAFLGEADREPGDGDIEVRYLEVRNTARLLHPTSGPDRVPSYRIDRELFGWGRSVYSDDAEDGAMPLDPLGLEYTSVATLVQCPLRYRPDVVFCTRPHDQRPVFATTMAITFGEFLHAIFREIGYHGSPEARDESMALAQRDGEAWAAQTDADSVGGAIDALLDSLGAPGAGTDDTAALGGDDEH